MPKKELNIINKIKFGNPFNGKLLMVFFISIILIGCDFNFNKNARQLDLEEYTEEVEFVNFDYQKKYALPGLYSTKQKLDRIIFDLEYFHNQIRYESKAIIYWKNLTPNFQRIVENKEMEKLMVRCKKESPKQAMIFLKVNE